MFDKHAAWASVLAFAVCGCGGADESPPTEEATLQKEASGTSRAELSSLTGEAIFRGVFLGDGPAASLVPPLWRNPTVLASDVNNARLAQLARQAATRKTSTFYVAPGRCPTWIPPASPSTSTSPLSSRSSRSSPLSSPRWSS